MIVRNYPLKMTAAAIVTCNHDSLCKVLISNGSTPRRQRQQLPWWNRHLGIAAAGSQTFSLPRGPVTISTVAISRDKDKAIISEENPKKVRAASLPSYIKYSTPSVLVLASVRSVTISTQAKMQSEGSTNFCTTLTVLRPECIVNYYSLCPGQSSNCSS